MKEKRTEDMIHEDLESGGSITQAKGHDQKLIVALMSSKCSLMNVCLFHTYLVEDRTKIRNGKFVFNGEFVEGVEVRTHAPRTFFLKDHENKRRVGARTRADNTCVEQFLNSFLNFILLGKGVMIGTDNGRKDS